MDFIRRRLLRKINSCLGILLLVSGAVFAYTLLNPAERDFFNADEPDTAVEKSEPEAKPLQHYSVIEESGLFGRRREPEPEAMPASPQGPRMPELRLKGTVLFSSGGGYAIIQDAATGQEETVREGGRISGMELVSTAWNSAVLRGEPGEITLTIEEEAAPAPAGRPESPAGRTGRGSFTVPVSRVEQAIESAPELLREIDVRPNISGGRTEGFIVSGIRPGSLPDEFGLRDGDIITSVNRTNLDGPENVMRAYSEVMRRGFAAVEVMRDGERINLRYRIER